MTSSVTELVATRVPPSAFRLVAPHLEEEVRNYLCSGVAEVAPQFPSGHTELRRRSRHFAAGSARTGHHVEDLDSAWQLDQELGITLQEERTELIGNGAFAAGQTTRAAVT